MPDASTNLARDEAAFETALAIADWRRRTHDLYREVRNLATQNPSHAHDLWRQGRDDLFAQHAASPLLPAHRAAFTGLAIAAYDEHYRFELNLVAAQEAASFVAATGTDGDVPYQRVARARLAAPEGDVHLDLWRLASYGGGLFLPLRDGTAGRTTYGGGRYVLDTVKGADLGPGSAPGTLVVDLNFAYNPSCAYDPMWACPLAPPGNTTAVPLPVGEQHRGPWTHDSAGGQ